MLVKYFVWIEWLRTVREVVVINGIWMYRQWYRNRTVKIDRISQWIHTLVRIHLWLIHHLIISHICLSGRAPLPIWPHLEHLNSLSSWILSICRRKLPLVLNIWPHCSHRTDRSFLWTESTWRFRLPWSENGLWQWKHSKVFFFLWILLICLRRLPERVKWAGQSWQTYDLSLCAPR